MVALTLIVGVASFGSLPWWQRTVLGGILAAVSLRSMGRLLPGAHPDSVTSISFESLPRPKNATDIRLRLRDGVERPAALCPQTLLLPGAVLLVCRFDRDGRALGPGQHLPRRVYVPLLSGECDPRDWRRLMWRLRRPPHGTHPS